MLIRDYSLDDLNTRDIAAVSSAVVEIQQDIFPVADSRLVSEVLRDTESLFEGSYWDYQGMDTVYHDLEHTLQATLCWIRIMANRHLLEVEPVMTPHSFICGLFAVLLHDIGYLKEAGDNIGTGAKYTFVHEHRSCDLAELYLTEKGWSKPDIFVVQHLISCTGPRSIPDAIPFKDNLERINGEAICTADYLGQISDPNYIEKLPFLFKEFEESDDYREIPRENRMFKSSRELLHLTPYFWKKIVLPKLDRECHALFKFLAHPYPDGENPYLEKVESNITTIRKEAKKIKDFEKYFGKRSLNFWG